jgi:hypothetical protein
MKLLKLILAATMACAAFGQDADLPKTPKLFTLKYIEASRAAAILDFFGPIRSDNVLKTIVVHGTPATHLGVEEALKKIDVPPVPVPPPPPQRVSKNVELTFHAILASAKGDGTSKLPADLEGVGRNLTTLFGFNQYAVLEVAQIRSRDGANFNTYGTLRIPIPDSRGPGMTAKYAVSGRSTVVDQTPRIVSLANLGFDLSKPEIVDGKSSSRGLGQISTNIDIKEGQKVVVGKATMDGSDSSIILVVTAKVVD